MTDDLVAFLKARLGEDETVARGAGSLTPWSVSDTHDDGTRDVEPAEAPDGLWHGEVASHIAGGDAAHIARHDPARVLREVEAKRAIMDGIQGMVSAAAVAGTVHVDNWVLRTLAAVYSDHPGYRPEWATET